MKSLLRHAFIGMLAVVAITVSACGGGGQATNSYTPNSAPTSSPTSQPVQPASGTLTTSTTSTVALPSLAASGITVGGTLSAASAVATLTETVSATAPSGVTALIKARDEAARRAVAVAPSPSPLLYIAFTSTPATTLSAVPAFSFTLPSITAGDNYYVAYDGSNGWQFDSTNPGTISGNNVSFTASTMSVPITATQPAVFALVAVAGVLPTPPPTPAPTPSTSTSTIVFDINASPTPAAFTVSETGYSGAFTSKLACTNNPSPAPAPTPAAPANVVASLTPATATPASAGAPVTFTVTPGAETGSCTATITDAKNNAATVTIDVNSTNVTIFTKRNQK